jgi:murein DD-endopeptidase MepM/ murein hydrolase activator NlpD
MQGKAQRRTFRRQGGIAAAMAVVVGVFVLALPMAASAAGTSTRAAGSMPAFMLPVPVGASVFVHGTHTDAGFDQYPSRPKNAIDVAGGNGHVYAAAAGTVRIVHCTGGPFVVIDHAGGWHTGYYHMVNIRVANGQVVGQGALLGDMGTATPCGGSADGAHVHFTLWQYASATTGYPAASSAVAWQGIPVGGWRFANDPSGHDCDTGRNPCGSAQRISDGHTVALAASLVNYGASAPPVLQNVLANPGFEQGTAAWSRIMPSGGVTNYVAYQVPARAHDGSWFLETNETAPGGSVYQDVPASVSAGQRYTFSTWVRVPPGAPAPYTITLALWGTGLTANQAGSRTYTIGTTWQQVAVTFNPTAAHSNLRAQIYLGTVGGNLDLDGASLVDNGLVNAGFELGTNPPTAWSRIMPPGGVTNYVAYQVPARAHDGSWFLETNETAPGGSVYQDVPASVTAGQRYAFSIWAHVPTGAPTPYTITLALWGLGVSPNEAGSTSVPLGHAWQRVTVTLNATAAHSSLRAQVYLGTTGGQLDLDGASLARA